MPPMQMVRPSHQWIYAHSWLDYQATVNAGSGVVEVNPIGGFEREILIAFKPEKLLAFGLTARM